MIRVLLSILVLVLSFSSAAPAAEPAEGPKGPDLAELPHWPVGMKVPPELTEGWKPAKRRHAHKAEILVWTPPGVDRIRAVLLVPNNTDSKHFAEHDAFRKVAERHGIGVVYFRRLSGKVVERVEPPKGAETTMNALLAAVAERTGIEEYRHAPWITFGKSSRGRFPFRTTWWMPRRVIASISYHGETPTWPIPDWARTQDQTVLHVNVNGRTEWMGTWYRHVRPCLLNYRFHTPWLPHPVVVHGVGHGNYADAHGSKGWGKPVPAGQISVQRVWDYLALYVDKACQLRLPEDTWPTAGPVTLRQIDPATGYLIHPRAVEVLLGGKWRPIRGKAGRRPIIDHVKEPHEVYAETQGTVAPEMLIRKAADVPADERPNCFWVADRPQARAWLKLHNIHDKNVPIPE